MGGTFLLQRSPIMRKTLYISLLVVCSLTLVIIGFRLFYHPQDLPDPHKKLLARVGNQYLYQEDVPMGVDNSGGTTEDVVVEHYKKWLQQYVKKWVSDKLLYSKAQKEVRGEQRQRIEKQVTDFNATLLGHTYLQHLIDQQLHVEVSEEEIQAYYQTHAENFKLQDNIFKGRLIIIPKHVTQVGKVKQLLKEGDAAALVALQDYCAQNATFYLLDNSNWVKWDDLVAQTNAKKTLNYALEKIKGFKKPYLKEIQDYIAYYYLQIEDYKAINDIAPLELVSNQIHKIMLHNRKIKLADAIRDNMLEQATPNQDYTIYDDENKN